jgi:serine/threonine-protein kinase HipA
MNKHKAERQIQVFAHWAGIEQPQLMGTVYAQIVRGSESISFEYDKKWLSSKHAQELDPSLGLYSGRFHAPYEQNNFGVFLDSSPDRWGRLLMKRREAILARQQQRDEKQLMETDFLLGVYDLQRMGGLRFKETSQGPFLNDTHQLATPAWTSLRELAQVSLKLEQDTHMQDPDYVKWINMLIAPGSSLGGARPKAGVKDADGNLWIGKFPSNLDNDDVGAWEMVVNQLARNAGVQVAQGQIEKFGGHYHTYLTKRFDRNRMGERIHFASAMTLLGYKDGQNYHDGISYLELAEYITTHGADQDTDLQELWRRIVFNIAVCNTDDHLRNHGLILTPKGWRLSPAYDLNPIETGTGLKLNITDTDNSLSADVALAVIPFFRLKQKKAEQIINQVRMAVSEWEAIATALGISKGEQQGKKRAFSHL